jgi:3-hydroxyisobutyrate dehydrogenase-like beta-hydroxyacid dehydrogenase
LLEKLANILTEGTLESLISQHIIKLVQLKLIKYSRKKNMDYIECPVMGGPVQAEEGVLGGIVGGTEENFRKAEPYLKMFCKNYFHFGCCWNGRKI